MVALATDKLLKVGNPGSATTLSSPGYTVGATSITVGSTSNWPTDTGVVFAIDEAEVVNGVEVQVAGTYNEYIGTVASGTSITNVAWVLGSGDRNYASGALTRVYIPVSAERENRIVEWGLVHADQDGTLKAGAVDNAAVLADDVVETAKIKDGAVTNAKLSTTAGELGGAWASWTPTFTNLTVGSSVVNAKYAKIGKTIHFRLSIVLGAGSSVGTNPEFTLPVAAAVYGSSSGENLIGISNYLQTGVASMNGALALKGTTNAQFVKYTVSGANLTKSGLSATSPFTFAPTHELNCVGTYEAV